MKKILLTLLSAGLLIMPLAIAKTNSPQTNTGAVVQATTGELPVEPKQAQSKAVSRTYSEYDALPDYITDKQKVIIHGFPEESIATYIATNYYRRAGKDMLLTMLQENGGFNIYSKSPTNDYGLCQWHYDSSTDQFIDSTGFYTVDVQMNECIWLWNKTAEIGRNKTKRAAYSIRKQNARKITIVDIQ